MDAATYTLIYISTSPVSFMFIDNEKWNRVKEITKKNNKRRVRSVRQKVFRARWLRQKYKSIWCGCKRLSKCVLRSFWGFRFIGVSHRIFATSPNLIHTHAHTITCAQRMRILVDVICDGWSGCDVMWCDAQDHLYVNDVSICLMESNPLFNPSTAT